MTRRWRNITQPQKTRIIQLWDAGHATSQIAVVMDRHKNIIHDIIKEARPEAAVSRRYAPRRTRVWHPDILDEAKRLWNTGQWTGHEIAQHLNERFGTNLNQNCVNSRMRVEKLPHPKYR